MYTNLEDIEKYALHINYSYWMTATLYGSQRVKMYLF